MWWKKHRLRPQDDVQVLGVSALVAGKTWPVKTETTSVAVEGEASSHGFREQAISCVKGS